MTLIWAVTKNLGCASPSTVSRQRRLAAAAWAESERSRGTSLVFAQEVPDNEWIEQWTKAGYSVTEQRSGPRYRVRSAVLWSPAIRGQAVDLWSVGYHGTYLAAAELNFPETEGSISVVSMHASPVTIGATYEAQWRRATDHHLPKARAGTGSDAGRLWDSDMVLASLEHLCRSGSQVLAAGDLNEALRWDDHHQGSWGAQYFENVRRAGLVSVLHDERFWPAENPTYFGTGHTPYQLDHVLASPSIASHVLEAQVEVVDPAAVAAGRSSDHAAIRFALAVS